MSFNKLNIPKEEVGCGFCNGLRTFYNSITANLDYRSLIKILKIVKGSKFFKPFESTVWFRAADFLLELAPELIDKELELNHINEQGRNILEVSNRSDSIKHYIMDNNENIKKLTKQLTKVTDG